MTKLRLWQMMLTCVRPNLTSLKLRPYDAIEIRLLLSWVSMQCKQSTILFYQFCLSVCLSVQCRNCVKMNGHIVTLFDVLASAVFQALLPLQNSKGNPVSGGVEYKGWTFFFANITIYLWSATRWGYRYYGTLLGSHRWPIDRCRFQWRWVTLKDRTWLNK